MADGRESPLNEVRDAIAELTAVVKQAPSMPDTQAAQNHNRTEINITAGGTAVAIAIVVAMAAGFMAIQQGSTVSAQAAQIAELNRRSDRMQDYINAIYMMAPHLKPKADKENVPSAP